MSVIIFIVLDYCKLSWMYLISEATCMRVVRLLASLRYIGSKILASSWFAISAVPILRGRKFEMWFIVFFVLYHKA